MVIPARRQEGGTRAVPLGHLEPENVVIEPNRPLEVGHLEVHVADGDPRVNRAETSRGPAHRQRSCGSSANSKDSTPSAQSAA